MEIMSKGGLDSPAPVTGPHGVALRSLLSTEARDGVRHVRRLQRGDFLYGQLNAERPNRRLKVLHLRGERTREARGR
jgi:hypothetical protein